MNIHELYGEIIKLTPYEGGDDDFRKTLSSALKKYSDLVDCLDEADRPDNWDALKRKKGMVMFHIPITMRRQVGTERYSIPGYPCLYLGNSIYVCWEEMNRPLMSSCWVSRLKNTEELELEELE